MRIVSKFYDFYDSAQGLGYDASLDYIRTPREVILTREAHRDPKDQITQTLVDKLPKSFDNHSASDRFSSIVIGFCGAFFPIIVYSSLMAKKDIYCHSMEDVEKIVSGWKKPNLKYFNTYEKKRLQKYFGAFKDLRYEEPFIINRSPIVILFEKHELFNLKTTWNGRLKDYEFQRVINPYQAFQEIEMFLSNLAVPEKPMPKVPDELNVQSHGFDHWSFRKKS